MRAGNEYAAPAKNSLDHGRTVDHYPRRRVVLSQLRPKERDWQVRREVGSPGALDDRAIGVFHILGFRWEAGEFLSIQREFQADVADAAPPLVRHGLGIEQAKSP